VRVMTFNVRGGLGMDGRRDTGRIAEVVRAYAPDVVCFQEVHQCLPWSGWINQPRAWERELALKVVFQRCVNIGVGGFGLAIASRLPMTDVSRRFLPSVGERRGALAVTVQTPEGSVRVWCTHWGLNEQERVRQAECLGNLVNQSSLPTILCGDFNERSDAPAVRRLFSDTGLCDAGAQLEMPTYPADSPIARIDFVLHSACLSCVSSIVVDTQASDHRPLQCDIQGNKLMDEVVPKD
jgi:endonuclease/exonuclease/phosphatase family metal-dependent hydrolase